MVLSRLLGGKKRTKKVYTPPKKIKHKRKKVKLSVLKFYEVSYRTVLYQTNVIASRSRSSKESRPMSSV